MAWKNLHEDLLGEFVDAAGVITSDVESSLVNEMLNASIFFNPAEKAARNKRRFAAGICKNCPKKRQSSGAFCKECQVKDRSRNASFIQQRKRLGLCLSCPSDSRAGKVFCQECQSARVALKSRIRKERIHSGECVDCQANPEHGSVRCRECIDYAVQSANASKQAKKAAGKCLRCSGANDRLQGVYCSACLAKDREQRRIDKLPRLVVDCKVCGVRVKRNAPTCSKRCTQKLRRQALIGSGKCPRCKHASDRSGECSKCLNNQQNNAKVDR